MRLFCFLAAFLVLPFTYIVSAEQGDDIGLLQLDQQISKLKSHSASISSIANPALAGTRPVTWIHIPKTGSGLIISMIKLADLCAADAPYNELDENTDPVSVVAFTETYCEGSFYWYPRDRGVMHETGMGDIAVYQSSYAGHTFGMFRQPEQRTISQYYYKGAIAYSIKEILFSDWDREPTMAEYAKVIQGMSVKMLTRTGLEMREWLPGAVTQEETDLAVSRVQEAFVYIGITDDWDRSMCLLHAMYGGDCVASDFKNTRPGANNTNELYPTDDLLGFVDVYDGQVYAEALRVYDKRLEVFGVNMESCSSCFADAAADE